MCVSKSGNSKSIKKNTQGFSRLSFVFLLERKRLGKFQLPSVECTDEFTISLIVK